MEIVSTKKPQEPVILPIISPDVKWEFIRNQINIATKDTLNRSLDSHGIKIKQDQSIIPILAQFSTDQEVEPYKSIREANSILKHLSFSFFCIFPQEVIRDVAALTELFASQHHSSPDAWILGGTLLQWKTGIFEVCQHGRRTETRLFMNTMLLIFQLNGYGQVWESFEKFTLLDRTFILKVKQ